MFSRTVLVSHRIIIIAWGRCCGTQVIEFVKLSRVFDDFAAAATPETHGKIRGVRFCLPTAADDDYNKFIRVRSSYVYAPCFKYLHRRRRRRRGLCRLATWKSLSFIYIPRVFFYMRTQSEFIT